MKKTQAECFNEQMHYTALTLPKFAEDTFQMAPVMLKSNLFRPGIGARAVYADYTPMACWPGWTLEFCGEELRQDDQRVLLALIKLRAGHVVTNIISFVPRTFVREVLNWSNSGDSVAKLAACLERLHKARIKVTGNDGTKAYYSFVQDMRLECVPGDEVWTVNLSEKIVGMFKSNTTFLSVEKRLGMKDGLTTWLYGVVKADACLVSWDLAQLHKLAGSTYEQKDFNKALKKSLEELKAAGLISGYLMGSGKLRVMK